MIKTLKCLALVALTLSLAACGSEQGDPGTAGSDGKDGPAGAPGAQGPQGSQGLPGQDGQRGADAPALTYHMYDDTRTSANVGNPGIKMVCPAGFLTSGGCESNAALRIDRPLAGTGANTPLGWICETAPDVGLTSVTVNVFVVCAE